MEGYPKTAAHFSKEANLAPHPSHGSIKIRQQIQDHIHTGRVQSAIEALNDYDQEVSKSRVVMFPPFQLLFCHD